MRLSWIILSPSLRTKALQVLNKLPRQFVTGIFLIGAGLTNVSAVALHVGAETDLLVRLLDRLRTRSCPQ
jgi:hypothetical protein